MEKLQNSKENTYCIYHSSIYQLSYALSSLLSALRSLNRRSSSAQEAAVPVVVVVLSSIVRARPLLRTVRCEERACVGVDNGGVGVVMPVAVKAGDLAVVAD